MEVCEPEMLAERIRGANLEVSVLKREPGVSQASRLVLPRMCLDRIALSSPMWFTGRMAPDCYTMMFISQCPAPAHSLSFQQSYGPGCMGFFAPGGMSEALTPAGYANATVTVPVDCFEESLRHAFPDIPAEWLQHGSGLRLAAASRAQINRFLDELAEMERTDPLWHHSWRARKAVERDLLDLYQDALRCAMPANHRHGSSHGTRRYSALRRMRGHIADHGNSVIRLDDLCEASGMSRRGLEYACQALLGVGVNAYLRLHRLQGARRTLRAADPGSVSVKKVALDWGYWHLGRFARHYREVFGENPRDTLAAPPVLRSVSPSAKP